MLGVLLTAPLLVETWLCFMLQVGNSDIGDVNIIAFRQINQFDLSGNVITSSEYLSTLCVSSSLSSLLNAFAVGFITVLGKVTGNCSVARAHI